MISAILGGIAGSTFERGICTGENFDSAICTSYDVPPNRKDETGQYASTFTLPGEDQIVTDDSVFMIAIERWLLDGGDLKEIFLDLYRRYPNAGNGGIFIEWGISGGATGPKSVGNGAAMRVAPVAYAARSKEDLFSLAEASARVTHISESAIAGAKAIAYAVWLSNAGHAKRIIMQMLQSEFPLFDLRPTSDDWRQTRLLPDYKFSSACEENVPIALRAFYESNSHEEAIRRAISVGGDTDTTACMAGAIAGSYWGMKKANYERTLPFLDEHLKSIVLRFEKKYPQSAYFCD
jgi:ADP-ribosylglycohydrolase